MSDQVTTSLAQAKVLVMEGQKGDTGPQGPQGVQGPKGEDGVSPTVTITEITRGHRVKITDAEHPNGQNFDVMDGFNGTNGANGIDGHSPYIDPTTNTWWYFDDASGLWVDSNVDPDGYPGTAGADGYSPVVTITTITGGHRVTITDKTHPQGQSFDVMDGEDGQGGGDTKTVYREYDSMFDDDPGITITSSNPNYATAATIAAGIVNDDIRDVQFTDVYTFDVYRLVYYSNVTPETLMFACVKSDRVKFCTMTGTSGKPTYSSVPISGLPTVTASDNGKFLRVVNGTWAAETVPSYQGGSY